ncbi:diadenylate cyclase [Bacillus cereus]|nr:diadenylate cyclase [Bacillus cereus]
MDTIDSFMWGYQANYQVSINNKAKELFMEFDKKLFKQVFVLGILGEKKGQKHPICFQPESKYCGYTPNFFREIIKIAKQIENKHPGRAILQSDPDLQQQINDQVAADSMRLAIEQLLNNDQKACSRISFCSMPYFVEGYFIFTILQLDRNIYESFYRLPESLDDAYHATHRNLIDAVTNEFLKRCTSALIEPNKGVDYIDRDTNEIFRTAGRRLMEKVVHISTNSVILNDLFDICHDISSMKYEGGEGKGRVILCEKNHSAVKMLIELKNPIELSNKRAVRKLLEISKENYYLISDGNFVYGLGEILENYKLYFDLFFIHFTKHYNFRVYYNEHILIEASYGIPNLPKSKVNREKFIDIVKRFFVDISDDSLANLWSLIGTATQQRHGTMIVISEEAKDEAKRLSKQSTLILPQKLNENLMSVITNIDGAVLLDKDSICYGIGVILDGIASENGDPSRGARYNSAIRYLDFIEKKLKSKTLIIIVSEDGFVDMIPDLMPRVDRGLLQSKIDELKKIVKENRDNNFIKDHYHIMSWFTEYEFYLSQDQCDEVNKLNKKIQDTIDGMKIIYKELKSNDKMDDSYLL